jgi:muramoyltetrapeptide carboxypeptidase
MSMVKPARLRRGDVIGVVAPASPPLGRDRLERGVRYLEGLGYRVELGAHLESRHGYLAGTDAQRLEDLNRMLRSRHTAAVFALRGGYGSGRLLPGVDFRALRLRPKIVVGYSDVTALQLAMEKKAGLVTFSGPMVASDFGGSPDPFTEEHFWGVLTSTRRGMKLPGRLEPLAEPAVTRSIRGCLMGGNLSLFVSLMGTPFLPRVEGRLLVFEDVGEHFHRIDRMLTQVRLGGILGRAAGIILGQFTECRTPRPDDPHLSLDDIFGEVLGCGGRPVFTGLAYGHVRQKLTVPWGVMASLSHRTGELRLEEAAVC